MKPLESHDKAQPETAIKTGSYHNFFLDSREALEHSYDNFQQSYDEENEDDQYSTNYYDTQSVDESFEVNPLKEIESNAKEDSFLVESTFSDTVFLVAGSFYLTISIWDLKPPNNQVDIAAYDIIACMAPFAYLFNSLIDIHLANRIRVYRKKKRRIVKLSNSVNMNQSTVMMVGSGAMDRDVSLLTMNDQSNPTIKSTKKKKSRKKRLRKFAAHRRDLSAALSFFLAALFGVFSVIAEWLGADETTLAGFDGLSVHMYMLSAIIAIMGSPIFKRKGYLDMLNLHDADTLETLGDIFFLIGSLVDSVLFDFTFDDDGSGWPILSSTLWCVDALLYLNSDWIATQSRQLLANSPFV